MSPVSAQPPARAHKRRRPRTAPDSYSRPKPLRATPSSRPRPTSARLPKTHFSDHGVDDDSRVPHPLRRSRRAAPSTARRLTLQTTNMPAASTSSQEPYQPLPVSPARRRRRRLPPLLDARGPDAPLPSPPTSDPDPQPFPVTSISPGGADTLARTCTYATAAHVQGTSHRAAKHTSIAHPCASLSSIFPRTASLPLARTRLTCSRSAPSSPLAYDAVVQSAVRTDDLLFPAFPADPVLDALLGPSVCAYASTVPVHAIAIALDLSGGRVSSGSTSDGGAERAFAFSTRSPLAGCISDCLDPPSAGFGDSSSGTDPVKASALVTECKRVRAARTPVVLSVAGACAVRIEQWPTGPLRSSSRSAQKHARQPKISLSIMDIFTPRPTLVPATAPTSPSNNKQGRLPAPAQRDSSQRFSILRSRSASLGASSTPKRTLAPVPEPMPALVPPRAATLGTEPSASLPLRNPVSAPSAPCPPRPVRSARRPPPAPILRKMSVDALYDTEHTRPRLVQRAFTSPLGGSVDRLSAALPPPAPARPMSFFFGGSGNGIANGGDARAGRDAGAGRERKRSFLVRRLSMSVGRRADGDKGRSVFGFWVRSG